MLLYVGAALIAPVACSDTDFSSSAPDAGEVAVGDLPRPPVGTDDVDDGSSPDSTADDSGVAVQTSPPTSDPDDSQQTSVPTVPASGVPGVDEGAAPVCVAWSRLTGTRQVLSVAANFGRLTDRQLARLEVIAAPLVRRALDDLATALDDEGGDVARERDVVVDELFGRVGARASAALAVLDELALPDGTTDLLAQVWLDGLRGLDPDAAVPALADLGPRIGPLVDTAATTFSADAPRWDDDAGLDVTGVSTPATDELVARECPDLSVIGVGDAV